MIFNFFTFLVYSPRGNSNNAKFSRNIMGRLKNGDRSISARIAQLIFENNLDNYFEDSTLVSVPRSTLTVENGLVPSYEIAEEFLNHGLGTSISNILQRSHSIPKSSSQYTATTRNTVDTHINSLILENEIIGTSNIIIIDDVLTLGRTAYAAAVKIKEAYPEKTVKIFCCFRTRSFEDNNILIDPKTGSLSGANNGGVQLPD